MLETINLTSQDLDLGDKVALGSVTIRDPYSVINVVNNNTIRIYKTGKYKVHGLFNVTNTDGTAVNATVHITANGNQIGLPITVTVPETTGASEIVIDKIINVLPSVFGDIAEVSFEAENSFTISGCLVEIYKL